MDINIIKTKQFELQQQRALLYFQRTIFEPHWLQSVRKHWHNLQFHKELDRVVFYR